MCTILWAQAYQDANADGRGQAVGVSSPFSHRDPRDRAQAVILGGRWAPLQAESSGWSLRYFSLRVPPLSLEGIIFFFACA